MIAPCDVHDLIAAFAWPEGCPKPVVLEMAAKLDKDFVTFHLVLGGEIEVSVTGPTTEAVMQHAITTWVRVFVHDADALVAVDYQASRISN